MRSIHAALVALPIVLSAFVACGDDDGGITTTNPGADAATGDGNAVTPSGTSSSGNVGPDGETPVQDGGGEAGPPEPDVDVTTESTTYDGKPRTYLLAKPRGYDPSKAYPLVMAFHGNPGTKESLRGALAFETVSKRAAFIVYPDALGGAAGGFNWDLYTPTDANKDMNFVRHLVDELKTKANIDSTHVFGIGFSGGSFFIPQMACRVAGFFRAIAVNSGGGPQEDQMGYPKRPDGCFICPGGPIPTLVIHGETDTDVSSASGNFTANCFADTNGCKSTRTATAPAPCQLHDECPSGAPVKWCLIPGMPHTLWSNALTEAWALFQSTN